MPGREGRTVTGPAGVDPIVEFLVWLEDRGYRIIEPAHLAPSVATRTFTSEEILRHYRKRFTE